MDQVDSVETVEATLVDKGGTPPVPQTPQVNDGFSGAPGDLQKDLALLAGTQEAPKDSPVTPEPEQPAQEAHGTAPETPVPDKFKNPDGTLNDEKLAKSKAAALAEYHKIEAELRKAQNERAQLRNQPQPPTQPVQDPVQLTALERGMAEDLIREAAAFGQQMPEWQAIAQARVIARGLEAKHAAEISVTEEIKQKFEDQERERQLTSIAEHDAWVFSPEGIKTLHEIRQSYPHVNQSKEPWQAAYDQHLANEVKKQRLSGMVQTPTPKAPTAKAPAPPVGAAPRAVVQPSMPDFSGMPSDQITAYAKSLGDDKAEDAFWAKVFQQRGLGVIKK